MTVFQSGRAARWLAPDHSALRLLATFAECGETDYVAVARTSARDDAIIAQAAQGVFGPVGDYAPVVPTFDPAAVGAECSRRIYAIASVNAVNNINLYLGSGAATDADRSIAQQALGWINSMRAACQALIAAQDATYAQDAHWPPCPPAVVAFAGHF